MSQSETLVFYSDSMCLSPDEPQVSHLNLLTLPPGCFVYYRLFQCAQRSPQVLVVDYSILLVDVRPDPG